MPTIGLCMVVKNQAGVISRCIESVRSLIDYVMIVDTGSTDGTQEVIRCFLRDTNLTGIVVEESWQDFASSRTSALAKLREHSNIDYALIMDADDQLVYDSEFDAAAFKTAMTQDVYDIVIRSGPFMYSRPQICRNRLNFRYRGLLHAFIEVPPEGHLRGTASGFYIASGREEAWSQDTYRRDAAVLERALETEQDAFLISCYTFYLAQIYQDAGEREKALTNYLKRAELGYWDQEVFVSISRAAQLKEALGYPETDIIGSYLKAYEVCPSRAESLYDAIRYCQIHNKFQQGYLIGKHAITIPNPNAGLFVKPWIYEFGVQDEFSVNAYGAGKYHDCLDTCRKILERDKIPADQRDRIAKTAQHALDRLNSLPLPEKPKSRAQRAMKFKSIVFYNHWHSGDLFTTRGLVKDIMKQIPTKFYYAHLSHAKTCIDLVDTMVCDSNGTLNDLDQNTRVVYKDESLFINTWVGAYQPELFPYGSHPSYIVHHKIYDSCYKILNEMFDLNLDISQDVWEYVPTIDYSKFDTRAVDDFLAGNVDRRIHLFCNGVVRSHQSSVGDMAGILIRLAESHPRDIFVATQQFNNSCENIIFTDALFQSDCDINEISYLSSHVNLIVGKNSGPFTYANTKNNLLDPTKLFVCLSNRVVDCLHYGLDIASDFRFSGHTDFEHLCVFLNDSIVAAKNKQKTDFIKWPRPSYGALLKSENGEKVYMIEGSARRWVVSPEVFLGMGFRWDQIESVPENYLRSFRLGPDLF